MKTVNVGSYPQHIARWFDESQNPEDYVVHGRKHKAYTPIAKKLK